MRASALVQQIAFYLIVTTVFLLPLFFLPITSDFYDLAKQLLLITSSLLLFILWTFNMILERQVRLIRSPLGLPFMLVLGSWLLSAVLKSPNKADALFEPTQAGTILALSLFFLVATNVIKTRHQTQLIFLSLLVSILTLSVASIVWTSGLVSSLMPLQFLQNDLWTPTGGPLGTLTVILAIVPVLLVLVSKEKFGSTRSLLLSFSLVVVLLASGMTAYRLFGTQSTTKPVFLPQKVSWAIALESLKNSPLIGTGPATYLSNFTRYRPISYNLTTLWSIRFSNSSNYYLEILSTLGLVGLSAYLFLAARTFSLLTKILRTNSESQLHTATLAFALGASVIFVGQLLIPTTLTLQFLLITLFTLLVTTLKTMGSSEVHEANIDIITAGNSQNRSILLPSLAFVIALILAIPSVYAVSRVFWADHLFQRSVQAANSNNPKGTYDALIEAIKTNPYQDSYRLAYSQTNILLATSLASQTEVSDENRNTISQLAQQAIREAKNAVALNPTKVANHENLASIYRSLIGSAQGAPDWTLATYQQAIRLDPANPNLRIAQGGVYYSLKGFTEAAQLFQQAVDLKPDFPNAYYNLSATFRELKDYDKAVQAMQKVVELVDPTSADYTKAASELEDLKKLAGQPATPDQSPIAPAQSDLESPEPFPTTKVNPPLSLPTDLAPISPTPTQ